MPLHGFRLPCDEKYQIKPYSVVQMFYQAFFCISCFISDLYLEHVREPDGHDDSLLQRLLRHVQARHIAPVVTEEGIVR